MLSNLIRYFFNDPAVGTFSFVFLILVASMLSVVLNIIYDLLFNSTNSYKLI